MKTTSDADSDELQAPLTKRPRTMTTTSESDSDVLQASVRVLVDPTLWRCISTFQHGIPMALYTFCVTHDPALARSLSRHKLGQDIINHIIQRVVQYGSLQMFEFFPLVRYFEARQWRTPSLEAVIMFVQHAIRANRVEMLEWILANHVVRDHPRNLWRAALRQNEEGDVRILDVLHRHKPISNMDLRELTTRLTNTALVGWIATNSPEGLDPAIMTRAVIDDNLELAQCLHQLLPTTDWGFMPYDAAFKKGRVQILMYLLEKRPHDMNTEFVERLFRGGHSTVITALKGSSAFREQARELATRYVRECNHHMLKRLDVIGWLEEGEMFSIDQAAAYGHLPFIKFLVERGLAIATTDAMDLAAERRRWDVVYYLHEHGVGGCTTRVMDAAATQGELNHVKFFHKQRLEGCTTRAMDGAAEHNCLDVLEFLDKNRTEGCTTNAMDEAATRGHIKVIEFLQRHRSEGCTKAAVVNALNHGHLAISRYLYKHYPSYFGPELLDSLLLRGVFDVWMELRAIFPDEANAVVEQVLFEAGKYCELATIRFIIHELGRGDIAHTAVDGAAAIFADGKSDWLRAVVAVTGPGSCRLSAVRYAVQCRNLYDPAIHLQYVISACSESGAHELVVSMLKEDIYVYREESMLSRWSQMEAATRTAVEIEKWNPEKEPLVLPPLHPVLANATNSGREVGAALTSIHGRAPLQWVMQWRSVDR